MATDSARISIFLKDPSLAYASTPFYLNVNGAQTLDQFIAEATTLGGLVDKLTGARISQVQAVLTVPLSGSWKAAANVGSDVGAGMGLSFQVSGATHPWLAQLPAILASKLSGTSLKLTDTDVSNFLNHIVGSSLPYQYSSNVGGGLSSLRQSFYSQRKYGSFRSTRAPVKGA